MSFFIVVVLVRMWVEAPAEAGSPGKAGAGTAAEAAAKGSLFIANSLLGSGRRAGRQRYFFHK
jgi:hypothetical protein